MEFSKSSEIYNQSYQIIPGGVNSPVRACQSVGRTPLIIDRASGARIYDVDGNEFIDYICSWGPMILGHAHPAVLEAIAQAAAKGISFGAPTKNELVLAELICDAVPSIDMVRLVNSGTEAAMSAIRLARGYTGRDLIVKFEGCYHGHSDGLLVKAGSGALTSGIPDSAGVPADYSKNTLIATYNDCEQITEIFEKYGDKLAAVIVEPVAANMGVVLPNLEFLHKLRDLTTQHGALLIFDEVITGFRLSYGGAQQLFNILPDITVLGKIVGGGMPIGAYGASKEIMSKVAPVGPVYQAGTLSGNPVAVAAGISTLSTLKNTKNIYTKLNHLGEKLELGMKEAANKHGRNISINRIGSLMSVFFQDNDVLDFRSAVQSDINAYKEYYSLMLAGGIYIAPAQYEAMFLCDAHTEEDIARTIQAADHAFCSMSHESL